MANFYPNTVFKQLSGGIEIAVMETGPDLPFLKSK
jgi:hypothetical protein